MKRKVIMILWTSLAISSAGARAGEWSQFRGSNGSGVSEESQPSDRKASVGAGPR